MTIDYDTAYPLSNETISAFRAQRFVMVEQLLDRETAFAAGAPIAAAADKLNTETRPLTERETYGRAFLQTFNLWRTGPELAAFVQTRRFAGVAARLMGVEQVRLYHDQALFKEPGGGGTPWHRDKYYWPLDTDDMITLWMPLVDVTPDMGMMEFAIGSHVDSGAQNLHISEDSDTFYTRYIQEQGLAVGGPQEALAGDAIFHSAWTLHRAHANTTNTRREVMTVIYFADGARILDPVPESARDDLELWLGGAAPGSLAGSALNPLL